MSGSIHACMIMTVARPCWRIESGELTKEVDRVSSFLSFDSRLDLTCVLFPLSRSFSRVVPMSPR